MYQDISSSFPRKALYKILRQRDLLVVLGCNILLQLKSEIHLSKSLKRGREKIVERKGTL